MRLLYWTGSTYAFKDVGGPHEEKYAILSHRWFARGEDILFPDVLAGREDASVKHKKGWTKLDCGIQQAKKDGFEFIWIDTCCIDKTSSAELGEAINSMYRWYQEADVCYAYLWDVKPPDSPSEGPFCPDGEIVGHNADTQLRDFADSVWFTRGWTLQELIAPQEVLFFSQGWGYLGSRKGRVGDIAATTGIDTDLLARRRTPEQYSVAQRMSWAAKRTTGREEDEAYCLLGLFDVSMAMLYGEGRRAFRKLQQEIIANSTDQSILAWSRKVGAEMDPHQLFASSPADFANCGGVERTWTNQAFRPFRADNRGIAGQFPVRTLRDGYQYLILNCEIGGRQVSLQVAHVMPKHADSGCQCSGWEEQERPFVVWLGREPRTSAPYLVDSQDETHHIVLVKSISDWSNYLRKYCGSTKLEIHRAVPEGSDRLQLARLKKPKWRSIEDRAGFPSWSCESPLEYHDRLHDVLSFKIRKAYGMFPRVDRLADRFVDSESDDKFLIAFKIDGISLPLTEETLYPQFNGALLILPEQPASSTYDPGFFSHDQRQDYAWLKSMEILDECYRELERRPVCGRVSCDLETSGKGVTELEVYKSHEIIPCMGEGIRVTLKILWEGDQTPKTPIVRLDVCHVSTPPRETRSSRRRFWDGL